MHENLECTDLQKLVAELQELLGSRFEVSIANLGNRGVEPHVDEVQIGATPTGFSSEEIRLGHVMLEFSDQVESWIRFKIDDDVVRYTTSPRGGYLNLTVTSFQFRGVNLARLYIFLVSDPPPIAAELHALETSPAVTILNQDPQGNK